MENSKSLYDALRKASYGLLSKAGDTAVLVLRGKNERWEQTFELPIAIKDDAISYAEVLIEDSASGESTLQNIAFCLTRVKDLAVSFHRDTVRISDDIGIDTVRFHIAKKGRVDNRLDVDICYSNKLQRALKTECELLSHQHHFVHGQVNSDAACRIH